MTETKKTKSKTETIEQPTAPQKATVTLVSAVDLWRHGGKSRNARKTEALLEELIKKTGLK